ncbi:hypothetical protein KFK09_006604 [Dendrobium nobile]|uniref:Metallothionein-like protein n=1 Tax=Dendrobium nobile TaxID=94219 RepID=A0A8T3BUH4_DENNO|nr:hypothetical protein KFK09_006604 [Dendrobium nobile]
MLYSVHLTAPSSFAFPLTIEFAANAFEFVASSSSTASPSVSQLVLSCSTLARLCNMYPGLAEEKITTTQTVILGLVPTKGKLEGFEMAEGSEHGCKCGSNCTCDPCNCK